MLAAGLGAVMRSGVRPQVARRLVRPVSSFARRAARLGSRSGLVGGPALSRVQAAGLSWVGKSPYATGSNSNQQTSDLRPNYDTAKPKKILDDIRAHHSKISDSVALFAKYLGSRLTNPRINTLGFINEALVTLIDLQNGIDGSSGQRIEGYENLIELPPVFYRNLELSIPFIAKIAFGEVFGAEVQSLINTLNGMPDTRPDHLK